MTDVPDLACLVVARRAACDGALDRRFDGEREARTLVPLEGP